MIPDEQPKFVFRMQNRIFFAIMVITGVAVVMNVVLHWPMWTWLSLHGFALGMVIANALISYAQLQEARAKLKKGLEELEATLKDYATYHGLMKALGSPKKESKNMGSDEEWFKP